MIQISKLPLIQDAAQFNAAKLILLVDVLFVGDTPRKMREHIKNNHGGFIYDKKTYIPITLTGTPQSLIANAGTPIIALTANALEVHRQAWEAAGVQAFLTKPIDPALLARTLADACAADGVTAARVEIA